MTLTVQLTAAGTSFLSSAQFVQRPPVTPRWFPDCREGVSHTTSDHSDRATDGGGDRVKDTVEENRKKIRCVRDRRMKGQRVLRSDMKMDILVSSNRCKPQRIYGNGAGHAVNFNLKKKMDALVIDKAENVKEVIHERERGHGDRGQRVKEMRWQRGAQGRE